MNTEDIILAKLQHLPERERGQLLRQIDQWMEQNATSQNTDAQQALAAIESTWGSVSLSPEMLGWIAEDKELEYEIG